MRAFYGMRNGRVVHAESVQTDNHEEQKRLARSRMDEFDCIEIWDGSVLCVRVSRQTDTAAILDFKANSAAVKVTANKARRRPAAA